MGRKVLLVVMCLFLFNATFIKQSAKAFNPAIPAVGYSAVGAYTIAGLLVGGGLVAVGLDEYGNDIQEHSMNAWNSFNTATQDAIKEAYTVAVETGSNTLNLSQDIWTTISTTAGSIYEGLKEKYLATDSVNTTVMKPLEYQSAWSAYTRSTLNYEEYFKFYYAGVLRETYKVGLEYDYFNNTSTDVRVIVEYSGGSRILSDWIDVTDAGYPGWSELKSLMNNASTLQEYVDILNDIAGFNEIWIGLENLDEATSAEVSAQKDAYNTMPGTLVNQGGFPLPNVNQGRISGKLVAPAGDLPAGTIVEHDPVLDKIFEKGTENVIPDITAGSPSIDWSYPVPDTVVIDGVSVPVVTNPAGEMTNVITGEVITPSTTVPPAEGTEPPPSKPDEVNWQKLKLAGTMFTTIFPFSLPWDVGRAFDAVFGGFDVGNKPVWDFSIDFMGSTYSFEITIPDMIFDWTPFIQNAMLIMFDIGIVYSIRKWLGGAS